MNTILIVEDDYTLQQSLKELLELKNYDVMTADTYQEAVQYFSDDIHLVIIDIELPDGNGIDLCQYLRSLSHVPILFLTANNNEEMLVKGLDSGGDDYMTKPFRIKEFYARIGSLLRRSQIDQDCMVLGDLYIDFQRYEIKKNDQYIQLAQVDYEIFFMLARNKNQVLTRNQLIEILEKDGQYCIEDNTLSVHMKRIREKLGLYHNKSYIETLRGIGYRIDREVLYGNK